MMESDGDPSFVEQVAVSLQRKWQHILDRSTVYVGLRWVIFVVMLGLYALRVFYINGWFIVTYGLGIYLLNNFIGFLSPQMDPESEGPLLPTNEREEYRPFARRLPEFKFWYQCAKATWVAFGMTFFDFFDVPVYWPILLLYFISLFVLTMKRQIRHMIKHRYVPWSNGKAKYAGGGEKRMAAK
ncbi:rer1a [Nannochloropsis oceanica]